MREDAGRSVGLGFGRLREDAARLLAAAPEGLDAGALARALFGTEAGERWVPLLATVLGGDERLNNDNGRWVLARARRQAVLTVSKQVTTESTVPLVAPESARAQGKVSAPAARDDHTIVALALQTTGADPRRHRI